MDENKIAAEVLTVNHFVTFELTMSRWKELDSGSLEVSDGDTTVAVFAPGCWIWIRSIGS